MVDLQMQAVLKQKKQVTDLWSEKQSQRQEKLIYDGGVAPESCSRCTHREQINKARQSQGCKCSTRESPKTTAESGC